MAFYDQLFACSPTRMGRNMNRKVAQMHWREISREGRRTPQYAAAGGFTAGRTAPGLAANIATVVEIGPGTGEFAAVCIPSVRRYQAVDANERICETVRKLGGTAVRSFVPPLPFPDSSADVVYACSVIEHMPNPASALSLLEEMKRVARPGGLVAVYAPDILAAGQHFWNSEYSHAFPTSRRRLLQMATDVGLATLRAEYCYGPYRGPAAAVLGTMMKYFPDRLAYLSCFGVVPQERFYKTRTAFLRSVLLIARKAPEPGS